ncbi:uncharacterized protein LOC110733536 [Chenopodium quinoa]|uniref:uncharacterized protein LOC110733536 n=1 Tax=Chenopodium quinoa TaxID=63459 RepID=UPI000B77D8B7|nr:uncharacterized protein LOC110733536 [Chenopodium quinoa]
MEAEQRRSKRKPLSDCTNTLQNRRKNPSISSKIPKSQTLIKPPKPFNSSANIVSNKQVNTSSSICSSPKSNTSTGSNNSQNISSIPRSPEPPAAATPLSDAGGVDGKKSRLSADQSQRHDASRKDKGKMVADDLAVDQSQRHDAPRKDKGKMVADVLALDQSQRHDAPRKDKGKMVADASIIQLPTSLTSNSLQVSSSSAPAHCSRPDNQSVQNENLHTQTIKDKGKAIVDVRPENQSVQNENLHTQTINDKGKAIVDATVIESPSPWTSKYLHSPSSSFTSDDSLSKMSAVYSQKLHVITRKDKGKMVLETPTTEASEPSTPHAPHASQAASGTRERPLTVYTHRKARQGKKHAAGKISEPLTCPPAQRIKKKGLELDSDQGDSNSGSHTDPLPVHKKKRSRQKYDDSVHVLPKEEVERLRAMYADIDAYELPEEVASESELE